MVTAAASKVVGVVLVHGIGSQTPGRRAREMTISLCDDKAFCELKGQGSTRSTDATRDPTAGASLAYQFGVHGVPVQLREAIWAPLSHPDNPPRIQLVPYIFPEFVDTVTSAFAASSIGWLARRLTRRRSSARAMILWGFFFALTVLFLWAGSSDLTPWQFWLIILPSFSYALYYTHYSVRYRYLILRRATRMRRITSCVFYGYIALNWGLIHSSLFIIPAEILLFMGILVVVAVAASFIMYPIAQVFRELAKLAAACRMERLRVWVHRLGWVMVVMPVHAFLQATKASGNLISILFSDKRLKVRAAAACWLVGVYVGFLLVVLFCELWMVFPIVPVIFPYLTDQPEPLGIALTMMMAVPVFAVYLPVLKVCLPAIDLLTDIENYHLASAEDRSPYQQRVEQAVQSLRESGCTEIHIVAHSLGSVIVYDWLNSTPPTDLPLTALHTIGSPLNKFWYIDHARQRRLTDANSLASFSALRWTNYWAFSDVVSGALTRYKNTRAQICDIRIQSLGPVLVSHVRYWKNAIVLAGIRNGIASSQGSGSATF